MSFKTGDKVYFALGQCIYSDVVEDISGDLVHLKQYGSTEHQGLYTNLKECEDQTYTNERQFHRKYLSEYRKRYLKAKCDYESVAVEYVGEFSYGS